MRGVVSPSKRWGALTGRRSERWGGRRGSGLVSSWLEAFMLLASLQTLPDDLIARRIVEESADKEGSWTHSVLAELRARG